MDVESRDAGWRRAAGGEGYRREGLKRKCREKMTDGRGEREPRTGRGHGTQTQFQGTEGLSRKSSSPKCLELKMRFYRTYREESLRDEDDGESADITPAVSFDFSTLGN